MAIGINPGAVQQAFTPNNQLGEIAAQNMALGAQLQQQELARKQQADNEAFQYDKYIEDKYNTGTGTPFDKVINNRIQKAHTALFEAQKKSKIPLTMAQRFQVTSPYLTDLPALSQTAKSMKGTISDELKRVEKEYPYLDQIKLEQALLKNAFRDDKGNIRERLDPESFSQFLTQSVSPGAGQLPYVNQGQLATHFMGEFDKLHPADYGQRFPVAGMPGVYDVPALRTGFQYNPTKRAVDVAYQNIPVNGGFVQGLPQDAMGAFATPSGQLMLAQKQQQLTKAYPAFGKLPEEQQQAIAGYQLFSNDISPRLAKNPMKVDTEEAKLAAADRKESRIAAHEAKMENLAYQRLDMEMTKDARKAAEKINDTPMAAWYNVIHGQSVAKAAMPKTTMYDPKLGSQVPVYDLTGIRKTQGNDGGLLDDPEGTGAKFRVVYNPINKTLGVIKYNKLKTGGYEPDLSQSEQVEQKDIKKVFSRFASQLGVTPTQWEDFYDKLRAEQ